ncbi:hypothetical protein AMTRI_Chr05g68330 [Amborella trichopoda]|uniref:Saposin B-type domain-containing protein n=1 Tax=Amborella trichopoda TaxID=13333 RepID=U5D535_AMBTC|nr:uncharacterized protein LOC18443762 [Amborella trichopoda]ERN15473.1 hypothetical protein AMTR_s00036p00239170 [Amborella trichopoda]|eukprot:XP_006854006.1 uncharacterized protein LOC18443762 [Amborella trichopoda]
MAKVEVICLLYFLLLSTIPVSLCKRGTQAVARREDIPFIKCQVCQTIAQQIHSLVSKKGAQISPKQVSEYQIIEIAENICNLKKEEADWILRFDIVEQGDELKLVDQETEGQCNSKCKTIERTCQEIMGYTDTDVAEFLFKTKPQIDTLTNFLCKDLSKACSAKPPPVPKDRVPGEPFFPKSSKDAEMERLLRSMEGMPGAPNMQMYSKDDLLNMKNFGDDEGDEDEDEENEFPSKLGKVLRDKESKKGDWKERIVNKIKGTAAAIKKHINKAAHHVKKWWRTKSGQKPSKPTKNAEL